ncbi:GNAT family N-acetyltransferase [Lentibacter algarum]|uniref:GNAT family N-acetyltransferase n=1 Tax=Lentibacter algarum TaxID=576131 RepID=UPI001C08D1A6|nr:GNAT family N-acetyltransferase [Lentibacter algarum]MBU2983472.1 GNAT family N-acetyltransferase [Lentibacter algarum]
MDFWIRDAGPADTGALATVFFTSVREAALRYGEAERAAWAPEQPDATTYAKRLEGLDVVLAESAGKVLGFMGLTPEGYLDLAFVMPEAQGKGVSSALYAVLESRALAMGFPRLTTHASLMARSFFERQGWQVDHAESVARDNEKLRRFAMSKQLAVAKPMSAQ